MRPETVRTVFQQALKVIAILILVLLLPGLADDLIVAMFQAATQVNEMTLSFVPKILVMLAVLMIAGPWMLRVLIDFTQRLISSIPSLLG